MGDSVETGLDIAFQDPLRMWLDQCFEALFDRISAGPLLAKPIRVMVSSSFRHGIECQQIQCLLGSIFHGGDTERAHRFAVRFRDINTSKGLRLIAPTLEFMYGLYLLLWGVPNFSVHTRGFLALVFRHSANGENFAAVRVGQQALQGSHLAPSAFLHRLHDTYLEPANVAVDGLPINGIPFCRFA